MVEKVLPIDTPAPFLLIFRAIKILVPSRERRANVKKLNVLSEVIIRIQNCAHQNQELFFGSELQTRYILIDPLLRAIGWDTEDPAQVHVEHHVAGRKKRVDYVLYRDDKPVAFIEAKKYGGCWKDKPYVKAVSQVASYSLEGQNKERVPIGIVTDGSAWYVYSFRRPGRRVTVHYFDVVPDEKQSSESEAWSIAKQADKLSPSKIAALA